MRKSWYFSLGPATISKSSEGSPKGHTLSPQQLHFMRQHFSIDFQLKVHQETKTDFEQAQFAVAHSADLSESAMWTATILNTFHCHSQASKHKPMHITRCHWN